MHCPLCRGENVSAYSTSHSRVYLLCIECDLIFLRSDFRLTPEKEKERYDKHQNNPADLGYIKFLSPMIDAVEELLPSTALGLDYGCGPNPVAASLLQKKGYSIDLFDPYYQKKLLRDRYDFILCSEVIEHFSNPHQEFEFLKAHLEKNAVLFIMTQIWRNQIDFKDWYYPRDPTHISFYSEKCLSWIQKNWGFQRLAIRGENLALFS
jgi:hypothetical protein